ncbi:protein of unknown function [Seinonella peptonophila]|uniref:Cytoskeleton protein RodZ-like C-terminal domain-containing protein n=1 Tax=Seinonella peptonophila TaxID=112248 RepID=A0A1M4TAN4_9BACL|nr:DUF4115 domain-containing protein [Seinonella peptonophila]SHE41589.1 protein of unknown function [Seinonella peptonophila]
MKSSTSKDQTGFSSFASYQELDTDTEVLSRSEMMRRQRNQTKHALWSKWYIWLSLILILIAAGGGVWWWLGSGENAKTSAAHSKTNLTTTPNNSISQEEETTSFTVPSKEDRAQVSLIDPVEANEKLDIYEVSNAKQVDVLLEAKKTTQIEVRSVDRSGSVLASKTLNKGQKLEQTNDKGLYVKINNPEQVTLSVNGVTIQTSKNGVYQFRLASSE